MEDERILALLWRRDERAVAALEDKYGAYCRSIALRILGSVEDAEETVNDVWLRVWNAIPPERPRVLSVWLGRVTRNLAVSRAREKQAQKRGGQLDAALEELSECVPAPFSTEGEAEARALERSVAAFLRTLEPERRDVFLARYWYLASVEEICRKTGFSQSKVKSMLQRIRGRLRTYLQEEGHL